MTATVQTTVTVGDMSRRLMNEFAEAGVDNPRLDARLLIRHALAADGEAVSMLPDPKAAFTAAALARLRDVGA